MTLETRPTRVESTEEIKKFLLDEVDLFESFFGRSEDLSNTGSFSGVRFHRFSENLFKIPNDELSLEDKLSVLTIVTNISVFYQRLVKLRFAGEYVKPPDFVKNLGAQFDEIRTYLN